MTQYNGIIRIAEKPWQQICWFTRNYDKEIGAIGIGKVKNQELYVEKLFFPTQTVSGAHVHFKPSDWGTLMKEMTKEELDKVIFYWHKHPDGMTSASQGDEDDTFDVFMDEDSKRKIFGFLQTAKNTKNDSVESEARIEMRKPLWASIEANVYTDKDEEIEVECEKILKEKITEGYASASDQPGYKGITTNTEGMPSFRNSSIQKYCGYKHSDTNETIQDKFGCVFEISTENGNVELLTSIAFETWVEELLGEGEFVSLIQKVSKKVDDEEVTFNIQPKKKMADKIEEKLRYLEEEIFGFNYDQVDEKPIVNLDNNWPNSYNIGPNVG